ncbi:hypothetical protein DSL72_000466 [Monilinia vaccinii-corymbosi]|uniref:Uncharacterized protein n=1 Tax=Monilinia vaccinii-corymbosi TaxID=61207 RepID=A0A8A3P8I3_9HELO|nr:hypothetical protein DSL72_000466 [Monilinia vaccinii-corymbosi]
MPTEEAPPLITAPVSPHDLNRALKRDFITCNNDICFSPATCAGPVGNNAACCEPGEDCHIFTTCYSYIEAQTYSSTGLLSDARYCQFSNSSDYPYCNTYVFSAYGLELIYCDNTSVINNQVISTGTYDWGDTFATTPLTQTPSTPTVGLSSTMVTPSQMSTAPSTSTSTASSPSTPASTPTASPTPTATATATHQAVPISAVIGIAVGTTLLGVAIIGVAILLWRRHSSTTNMPPPPSNPEIQVASYASPVSPSTTPHKIWAPATIGSDKPPSYGYEARRIGTQPDCQMEVVGEGVNAPSAASPEDSAPEQRHQSFQACLEFYYGHDEDKLKEKLKERREEEPPQGKLVDWQRNKVIQDEEMQSVLGTSWGDEFTGNENNEGKEGRGGLVPVLGLILLGYLLDLCYCLPSYIGTLSMSIYPLICGILFCLLLWNISYAPRKSVKQPE